MSKFIKYMISFLFVFSLLTPSLAYGDYTCKNGTSVVGFLCDCSPPPEAPLSHTHAYAMGFAGALAGGGLGFVYGSALALWSGGLSNIPYYSVKFMFVIGEAFYAPPLLASLYENGPDGIISCDWEDGGREQTMHDVYLKSLALLAPIPLAVFSLYKGSTAMSSVKHLVLLSVLVNSYSFLVNSMY